MTPQRAKARRTATSPGRREAILTAAARTFADKGLHASTTRQIGEQVSMLSGSLYYYFPSKEAMGLEIVTRYLTELIEAYDGVENRDLPPADRLAAFIQVSLEVSQRRPDEVLILHQDWNALNADGGLEAPMRRVEALWCGAIEAGVRSGDLREGIVPHLVYRTIMGALAWVPRWYRPDGSVTIAQIAESQADVVLRGIKRH
jgi:AcrR family transcriptional regulator